MTEHHLLLLLCVGAIFTFVWSYKFKDRLQMNVGAAVLLAILHTVYGVLTVKVFAIIEGFGDPSVVGNMSLFGGIFFMPIGYFLAAKLTKRKMSGVFDIYTPCMIFTVFCARVNCIIGGCCLGKHISGTSGMRWPTREAELIFYLILVVIFGIRIINKESNGEMYPIYILSYGILRFILEFLRESDKYFGLFHISHLWAAIAITLGVSFYLEIHRNNLKQNTNKKKRR